MAIAWVQEAQAAAASVAYGSNNTAGNFLGTCIGAAGDVSAVSDTANGSHTKATDGGDSLLWGDIWFFLDCAGSANTVSLTGGFSGHQEIAVVEYSGIATSSALDQAICSARGNTGLGQQPDSGNVTTTEADELLLGAVAAQGADATTWGSSFTELMELSTASRGVTVGERIVAATGTYKATATLDAGEWFCLLATFKADAGGGGGSILPLVACDMDNIADMAGMRG